MDPKNMSRPCTRILEKSSTSACASGRTRRYGGGPAHLSRRRAAIHPHDHGVAEPTCRCWQADLPINQPDGALPLLAGGRGRRLVVHRRRPGGLRAAGRHRFPAPGGLPRRPGCRSAVFYQIFPDRFANGDPATDPAPGGVRIPRPAPAHLFPGGSRRRRATALLAGLLRRRPARHHPPAGLPAATWASTALYLTPVFTRLLQPQVRRGRLRPRGPALRRRRGPGGAARGAGRARHALHAGHRAQPLRLLASLVPAGPPGSHRPRPSSSPSPATRTSTPAGWGCGRCPSSTTAAPSCAGAFMPARMPSSAAGCARPSAPTAGGWTWPTCWRRQGATQLGVEMAAPSARR